MRKTISLFATICILASFLSLATYAQDFKFDDGYILGDVNKDEKINAIDLLYIKANIAEIDGYEMDEDAADIYLDGKVNSRDALYLKYAFLNVINLEAFETSFSIDSFLVNGIEISEFCIVVPLEATKNDNVHYAAELMQKYVELSTGVKLNICYGEENATKAYKIIYHFVQNGNELYDTLGWDGYKVELTEDNNLNIYGNLRGNMYCTYDIIEKYLGFVFFSNKETFVKEQRYVNITNDINKTYVPKLSFRFVSQTYGSSGFESHFLPMKLDGTQVYFNESTYRFGTLTGPIFINAHSYGYYWRMSTGYQDQFEKGVPADELTLDLYNNAFKFGIDMETDHGSDWNGLSPWQPCTSSQEDYDNEFEGLVMTLKMKQDWGFNFVESNMIFSFSPMDNIGGLCTCRTCKAKATGSKIRSNSTLLKQLENYSGSYTIEGGYVYFEKEEYAGIYLDFLNRAAYDISHEENKYYIGEHMNDDDEYYTIDISSIKTYYPGMQLMSITYDLNIPATIRPAENTILMFCGQGCNHHYMGSNQCTEVTTVKNTYYTRNYTNAGENGTDAVMRKWTEMCHETGSQFWFWYYPTTYTFNLAPTPNLFNMYYDYYWMINEIGVDGIYSEGGGGTNSFEPLKAHMSAYMMYNPESTFEDFKEECKSFIHAYFGDGYNEIWTYLEMIAECSDLTEHCYINNYSTPDIMYNFDYLEDHYLEMRELLVIALNKADKSSNDENIESEYTRVRRLVLICDVLGLEAVWDSWYNNGTNIELYKSMYEAFIVELNDLGLKFLHNAVPISGEYTKSIFVQGNYGGTNVRL